MVDPDVRGDRIEAQIADQLLRIGHGLLARQYGLPPNHGVEVQARQPGGHGLAAKLVEPGAGGPARAEVFHQPGQIVEGEIRAAVDPPVGRLQKVVVDHVSGRCGRRPRA